VEVMYSRAAFSSPSSKVMKLLGLMLKVWYSVRGSASTYLRITAGILVSSKGFALRDSMKVIAFDWATMLMPLVKAT